MSTSREDLERAAIHLVGDEPQHTYVQNMARSIIAVLDLSDALPSYSRPDNMPESGYEEGYYDGVMKAVQAIREGMVWR